MGNTRYFVRIRGQGSDRTTLCTSPAVSFTTQCEAPRAPPDNIEIRSTDPRTIVLTWNVMATTLYCFIAHVKQVCTFCSIQTDQPGDVKISGTTWKGMLIINLKEFKYEQILAVFVLSTVSRLNLALTGV